MNLTQPLPCLQCPNGMGNTSSLPRVQHIPEDLIFTTLTSPGLLSPYLSTQMLLHSDPKPPFNFC